MGEILAGRLPRRRLRANPRVVKRKMANFGLKRAAHRHWPQPTKPPAQAVVVLAERRSPRRRDAQRRVAAPGPAP